MCKKIHVELYNVTEDIHYHVATTVLETRGRTKSKEEDFQYVGNVGFNGFLFFFSVSGRFLKGFHIHGGKSHLIYIGSPRAATRSSEPSSRSYHLMQTPSVVRYSYDESGGSSGGDDSSGTIYCPICNQPYDFTLESCPNGCEIEITPPEGDLIYCEICGIVYDSGRYRSCPNVARCSIVMFVASSLVFVWNMLVSVAVVSLVPVLGSVRSKSVRVRNVKSVEDIRQVHAVVRIVLYVLVKVE